jgi:hypothetical protein
MRRPGTALARAGNNERLFSHGNIATGARDVLAEEGLPQTLHNSLALHRPKLPFPPDLQDPQDGKDHNRCHPEEQHLVESWVNFTTRPRIHHRSGCNGELPGLLPVNAVNPCGGPD